MRVLFAIAPALVVCCTEGSGERPAPDAGDPDGGIDVSALEYLPCPRETSLGGFAIELAAEYTGVQGRVLDGVVPSNVQETLSSEGSCRHTRAPQLYCDPGCTGGQTCGSDGTCIPFPVSQDVGTVTVRGLAAPVEMRPVEPGFFYTNPDPLPHPGFEPGDGIELVAAGGTGDPFTLLGVGVEPLAGTPAEITIEGDRDLALSWEGSTATGGVMVEITVNVNQHGLTGSRLVCEVPDSGEALIPASLVTALVDDGLSGFPSILLRRRSADSATRGGGCIDLQVLAAAEITVVVPGLASCNGDEDCPEGEVCRGDLTCGPAE